MCLLSARYSVILLLFVTGCMSVPEKMYKRKNAFYAYIVGDLEGKRVYREYAASVYATPASCQKVITTLVAFKLFGPDYCYETTLHVYKENKSIKEIMLSFVGDPVLSTEDLLTLLKPIKNKKIHDKIILNATKFKTRPHGENIMIDDLGTSYAQPVSSINIDKNLINVEIVPTKNNKPAHVSNDASYKIISQVVTTPDVSSIKVSWSDDGKYIKVTGNINEQEEKIITQISPVNIDFYILQKIRKALKILNIKGKVEIVHEQNHIPRDMQLINKHRSAKLKDIIPAALKISDNLVFDSLYLNILHTRAENIENWSIGDKIIKDLMFEYFKIKLDNALFVDGSGISRYNRIQPRQLLEILQKGFVVPEFVGSLAKPGEENSSLQVRTTLPPSIIAKTGSLGGISCLCGYRVGIKTKAFVVMANSFAPPAADIHKVIDQFVSKSTK